MPKKSSKVRLSPKINKTVLNVSFPISKKGDMQLRKKDQPQSHIIVTSSIFVDVYCVPTYENHRLLAQLMLVVKMLVNIILLLNRGCFVMLSHLDVLTLLYFIIIFSNSMDYKTSFKYFI